MAVGISVATARACIPYDGSCGYKNAKLQKVGWAYRNLSPPGWLGKGCYWNGGCRDNRCQTNQQRRENRIEMMTDRTNLFAMLATNAVATIVAAVIAIPPAHADPHCTEDCGQSQPQYLMNELRRGGIQPDSVDQAVATAKTICAHANAKATREQLRMIAGDGSPAQTDVVINAAIKIYCPGAKA